jgi:hypothetical protein
VARLPARTRDRYGKSGPALGRSLSRLKASLPRCARTGTPVFLRKKLTVLLVQSTSSPLDEFVVQWVYPVMRLATDLNPDALRRPQAKNKVCTDKDFVDGVLGNGAFSFGKIIEEAGASLEMSRSTAARYLQRLVAAGVITSSGGLYWRTEGQNR